MEKQKSLGRRILRGILISVLFILLMLAILIGSMVYVMEYKITQVGVETSYDGKYEVVFSQIGEPDWPFGSTSVRIEVWEKDGEKIEQVKTSIRDDGASLRESNWQVEWYPGGLDITLIGSEQEDDVYTVYYEGENFVQHNTEAEVIAVIQSRYGKDVELATTQEDFFVFTTEEFDFQVQNDFRLTDNYYENYLNYFGETLSAKYGRHMTFEKKADSEEYIPVIAFHGRGSVEMESFCNNACDMIDECLNNEIAMDAGVTVTEFTFYSGEKREVVWLNCYPQFFDRTDIYNIIYQYAERSSMEAYEEGVAEDSASTFEGNATQINPSTTLGQENIGVAEKQGTTNNKNATEETNKTEEQEEPISEELWAYYLSIEPTSTYTTEDGTQYKMLAVDRALGSSYYILISTSADGKHTLVNRDPHCGSGGESKWIAFVEDDKVGFACLAYSGGSYGSLYRTEDGGKTFVKVELPSAQVYLPDGNLYNPFVMPEKVYEEDGKLYLLVGQGPDGDYYGEQGYCAGLYESQDHGKNWTYLGEEPVSSGR